MQEEHPSSAALFLFSPWNSVHRWDVIHIQSGPNGILRGPGETDVENLLSDSLLWPFGKNGISRPNGRQNLIQRHRTFFIILSRIVHGWLPCLQKSANMTFLKWILKNTKTKAHFINVEKFSGKILLKKTRGRTNFAFTNTSWKIS